MSGPLRKLGRTRQGVTNGRLQKTGVSDGWEGHNVVDPPLAV